MSDQLHALESLRRMVGAIWVELEGLGMANGVDADKITGAKIHLQDVMRLAREAVGVAEERENVSTHNAEVSRSAPR